MMVYNILPGLGGGHVAILAAIGAGVVAFGLAIARRRPSTRDWLLVFAAALLLSLLSAMVGTGRYSGMTYQERMGWPIAYHTITRNIEAGTDIAAPFAIQFDLLKFVANAVFWWVLAALAALVRVPGKVRVAAAAGILAVVGTAAVFALQSGRAEGPVPAPAASSGTTDADAALVAQKRRIIEAAYPEFADFENQPSFAGTSVNVLDDGEYYVAYILHGSGLPILQATCFRTDLGQAYVVGRFPDMLDSYAGYSDVDPRTCRGIR